MKNLVASKMIANIGLFVLFFFMGLFLYKKLALLLLFLVGSGVPAVIAIKVTNGKVLYSSIIFNALLLSLIVGLLFIGR